tara:strand:- start:3094 stop:3648 length:555 start_codon:yes stop_codon:yes gene_type:complete
VGILQINMKNIISVIIATIILFSCDSNQNITSFKIKNPYLSGTKKNIENVSISIFPGDAGGIEENVNRWRRQLNLPPQNINLIKKESMNNPLLGEYYLFHEFNNTENKAIIAAIIPQKNQTIFIKMNTSFMLSYDRKYEFILFCQSLYFNEDNKIVWNAPKNWIEKNPINMSEAFFEIKNSNEN